MYALNVYQEYIVMSALLIMLFTKGCFLFICCKFTSGAIMIVQRVTQYLSWQKWPKFFKNVVCNTLTHHIISTENQKVLKEQNFLNYCLDFKMRSRVILKKYRMFGHLRMHLSVILQYLIVFLVICEFQAPEFVQLVAIHAS